MALQINSGFALKVHLTCGYLVFYLMIHSQFYYMFNSESIPGAAFLLKIKISLPEENCKSQTTLNHSTFFWWASREKSKSPPQTLEAALI